MKKFIKLILLLPLIFVWGESVIAQPTTWFKPFDQFGSLFKVQETKDSDYIAVGEYPSAPSKILLIKVNFNGDTLWTRKLGSSEYSYRGWWIENLNGGNIISGETTEGIGSDAFLMKTDINGFPIWYERFGKQNYEAGYCVKSTLDGGFIILSRNSSIGYSDILLIKTDSSGKILYQKNYSSELNYNSPAEIDLTNSGYILNGSSFDLQQKSFIWLLKLNSSGDTLWTKKYNNNIENGTVGYSVQTVSESGNDGFIIGGRSKNSLNQTVSYVIKTDSIGNVIWDRTYLNPAYRADLLYSIREIPEIGYVFCGTTDSAQVLFKAFIRIIDYNGNIINEKYYAVPNAKSTDFRSIEMASDGGFIICGNFQYPGQNNRILLVKTDAGGNIVSINQNVSSSPINFNLHQNFPNPFNPETVIRFDVPSLSEVKLIVTDVTGKKISTLFNKVCPSGNYETKWNADKYSSGIYYCHLIAKGQLEEIIYSSSIRMVYLK